jgi:hypothetical protein
MRPQTPLAAVRLGVALRQRPKAGRRERRALGLRRSCVYSWRGLQIGAEDLQTRKIFPHSIEVLRNLQIFAHAIHYLSPVP